MSPRRCTTFSFIEQHTFCVDIGGVGECCSLAAIEFPFELGQEIGRFGRDDLDPASISNRFKLGSEADSPPHCGRG